MTQLEASEQYVLIMALDLADSSCARQALKLGHNSQRKIAPPTKNVKPYL